MPRFRVRQVSLIVFSLSHGRDSDKKMLNYADADTLDDETGLNVIASSGSCNEVLAAEKLVNFGAVRRIVAAEWIYDKLAPSTKKENK